MGLFRFASFTALIGFSDRRTPVRLSLVVGPLLRGASSHFNNKKGRHKGDLLCYWSGQWDSDPRHQPWQGCALPLSYTRINAILKT